MYLELASLVELCISESDSAKLEILFKDCLVVGREDAVVGLVDHLDYDARLFSMIMPSITKLN